MSQLNFRLEGLIGLYGGNGGIWNGLYASNVGSIISPNVVKPRPPIFCFKISGSGCGSGGAVFGNSVRKSRKGFGFSTC